MRSAVYGTFPLDRADQGFPTMSKRLTDRRDRCSPGAASPDGGFLMESLMAAIAIGDEEAKARINAFFEERAPRVTRLFGEGER
jgi:hypothetical protein